VFFGFLWFFGWILIRIWGFLGRNTIILEICGVMSCTGRFNALLFLPSEELFAIIGKTRGGHSGKVSIKGGEISGYLFFPGGIDRRIYRLVLSPIPAPQKDGNGVS